MALTIENNVLYGHDRDIVEFVRKRVPHMEAFTPLAVGLGVVRDGKLLGGAVFDQYTEIDGHRNIFVSIAFDSPAWATRKTIRQLFKYPFAQLACHRMTAVVSAENIASRSAVQRLGFTEEGVLREFFPGNTDAYIYGLLRRECHWIED